MVHNNIEHSTNAIIVSHTLEQYEGSLQHIAS